MNAAYLVGHITVKSAEQWNKYRAQVPATLQPWGAEITFRGKLVEVLSGEHSFDNIVVIRFPDKESIQGWHASPAYQALLPLRRQAAEMLLLAYETPPIYT
jgi:uncharacterized protein (DUF1330 family)